ncbi:MAG: 4'-phosphopantetheinyl transferase superfamily protein [Pseudomonadota bacterium]
MSRWNAISLPLKRRALPRRGEVDLWLTDLSELPLDVGPSGESRKEQVVKQRVQQRFILRLLLGSYLGVPGKDVIVERDEFDKPRLGGELAQTGLNFSLSHSAQWLAIALTRDRDIGVDIEHERIKRRADDLARRYFKGPDSDLIQGLDEPERSHCFLTQWTAREALVKAEGRGLARNIGRIAMDCNPTRICELPEDWPSDWQLIDPEWPSGVIGHVAVQTGQVPALNSFWLQTVRRS